MSSTVLTTKEEPLDHPLVQWVKAVYGDGKSIKFEDLFDGVLLYDLMSVVDPRPDDNIISTDPTDFDTRLFNWDLVLKSIQAYYKDVLQVYLCVGLPDIYLISREPCTDDSFKEVCKVLLLILGCAVQGEQKEEFIFNIKQLDISIQHGIVTFIQEITDESLCILPREKNYNDLEYVEKLMSHFERLLTERNSLQYKQMVFVHENREQRLHDVESSTEDKEITGPSKIDPEATDKKVKIRALQAALDEKDEQITDLKDEMEEMRRAFLVLKTENVDLLQKVHSVRSLQDDLDAFKERASKANSLEEEVSILRKKLGEVDFFKARIQELEHDYKVLEETKTLLEDQVDTTHIRIETVSRLENELQKSKKLLDEYSEKITKDGEKISNLSKENQDLKREMTSLTERKIVHEPNLSIDGFDNPILMELQESSNNSKLQAELEIQRLNQQLKVTKEELENVQLECSALKEESVHEDILKKQNTELLEKLKSQDILVNSLQNECAEIKHKTKDFEELYSKERVQKEKLTKLVEENQELITKMNDVNSVKELKMLQEKEDLQTKLREVTSRADSKDTNVKDLQQELNLLQQENDKLANQILDYEDDIKSEKDNLEKTISENLDLQQKLVISLQTIEDLKIKLQDKSETVSNIDKLKKEMLKKESTLKEKLGELERVKIDRDSLEEKLKVASSTVNELSQKVRENEDLQRNIDNLESRLSIAKEELEIFKDKANEASEQKLNESVHHLEEENKELSTQLQIAAAELNSLKVEALKCAEGEKMVNKNLNEVEIENEKLCEQLNMAEDEIDMLKEKLVELENTRKSLYEEKLNLNEAHDDVVGTLENEKLILSDKVTDLQKEVKKMKMVDEENGKLKMMQTNLQEELKKYQRTEETIKTLESEKRITQEELNIAQDKLNDIIIKESYVTSLEHSNEKLKEQLQEKKEEIEEFMRKVELVQQEKADVIEKEKGHQMSKENKFVELKNENLKLSGQVTDLQTEIKNINRETSNLRILNVELEEERSRKEKTEETIKNLESDKRILQEELDIAQDKLNDIIVKETYVTSLEHSNEELKEQLQEKEDEINEFIKRVEKVQQEKAEVLASQKGQQLSTENEFKELEENYEELSMKLQESEEKCEQLANEIIELKHEKKDVERNNSSVNESQLESLRKLHSENQDLLNQLRESDSEIQYLRSTLEKQSRPGELERVKEENQQLLKQIQESEHEIKELQAHLMDLDSEMEQQKTERLSYDADAAESLNQLEAENQNYSNQLRTARDEIRNIQNRLNDVEKYQNLYENKVEENKNLMKKNDDLRINLQQSEQEIQSLNQKMREISNKAVVSETQRSVQLEEKTAKTSEAYTKKQNAIIARLQTQNNTIQAHFSTLINQVTTAQNEMALLEDEHEYLLTNHEQMQYAHETLLFDYEKLQKIHELLTAEYEDLVSEYMLVRSNLINNKNREKSEPYTDTDDLSSSSSSDMKRYLLKLNQHDVGDYAEDTCDSWEDQDMSAIDHDMLQMESRYNTLQQINNTLEEENQTLLLQLKQLIDQNHELLTSAMKNKDQFSEEEKSYLEKLAELRRKKERLEEKLMEHYSKKKDTPKKSRGFSAIIKRVRAMILKSQKNKTKPSMENQNSISQLNLNNNSKTDSDVSHYHSNFENSNEDPEKLTLVEFLTEGIDKSH